MDSKFYLERTKGLLDVVRVRDISDMPVPVGGVIIPEAKEYIIDAPISSPYPIAHPGAGKTATFKSTNRAIWTYTGTEACFKDLNAAGNLEFQGLTEFHSPSSVMWDMNSQGNAASFQAFGGARFSNCTGLGTIVGPNYGFNSFFGTISNFGTGLSCTDIGFFELNAMFVFGTNTPTTFFSFQGTQTDGPINFILMSAAPGSNETLFNFDHNIRDTVNSVLITDVQQFGSLQGTVFAPGSMTQETPIVTVDGSSAIIPDSTVKAKLELDSNTTETVINTIGVPEIVNAVWTDGFIEERLCFMDHCTFDNTTDTVTTFDDVNSVAFNHNMSNGDIVTFHSDGGLPSEIEVDKEYYVRNSTATGFQISETPIGSIVDFTTDGTTPNYFCHETGNNPAGWLMYTGLTNVSLVANGWLAIDKSGSDNNCAAQLTKVSTTFVETDIASGSQITVQNGKSQSSIVSDIIDLSPGEGVRLKIKNLDSTNNLIVTDSHITFVKA